MAAGHETEIAALYRLPVAEFVAARDQLAKRLRSAGDREAARRVAALRRPSVSVWAANQLPAAAPLQAAATGDADTRAALAEGRLQADLDPAGFGFGDPVDQAEPAEDGPPGP